MRTSAFGLPATLTLPSRVRARHRTLAPCRFRGAVSAQENTSRAPTGSIESIDPHALQIPARRGEASLFHLFFNLIFMLNQNTAISKSEIARRSKIGRTSVRRLLEEKKS